MVPEYAAWLFVCVIRRVLMTQMGFVAKVELAPAVRAEVMCARKG